MKTTRCFVLIAVISALSPSLYASTIKVNCPRQSLQRAIDHAESGDTIEVKGTCSENVLIGERLSGLTLDGDDGAAIDAPKPQRPAVDIRGKNITLQHLTIDGGFYGVLVERGADAIIKNNTIQNATIWGIGVISDSFAVIIGNTIQHNSAGGMVIGGSSAARIGFILDSDEKPSPNLIQDNAGEGIDVSLSSSARIYGNTIQNNADNGIGINRGSTAAIASNLINNNGTSFKPGEPAVCCSGVTVQDNSFVALGETSSYPLADFFKAPNTTTVNNANYGLLCTIGGGVTFKEGAIGLQGNVDQFYASRNCNVSTFP